MSTAMAWSSRSRPCHHYSTGFDGRAPSGTPGAEPSCTEIPDRRSPDDTQCAPARHRGARPAKHHSVYVVYLKNPGGDGRAGYYVGMTGLTPEARFANHRAGHKAAGVVRRFGIRLVPRLYEHLNPMTYADAKAMEPLLAESLRKRGYLVYGGH